MKLNLPNYNNELLRDINGLLFLKLPSKNFSSFFSSSQLTVTFSFLDFFTSYSLFNFFCHSFFLH